MLKKLCRDPRDPSRRLREALETRGSGRVCPLCDWEGGRFATRGEGPKRRADARCPNCGSLERHRLAYLLLKDVLRPGQTTLHIAPETAVQPWLRSISRKYLSIDLDAGRAMRPMDITDLHLDDGSQTLVYCSHVLEHVPDDESAIEEIRRVLVRGALAVVLVPIRGATTDENLSVTDPEARLARYTQRDHVRFYGLDIVDRLTKAGFGVHVLRAGDLGPSTIERHSLVYPTTQDVFLCQAR